MFRKSTNISNKTHAVVCATFASFGSRPNLQARQPCHPGEIYRCLDRIETIPRTPWVSEHWARARKKYVKAQRSISIWESSWAGFTEKLVSYCVCLGQEITGGAEPSVWFKDPIVGCTQDSKHWICSIGQTIKHPQINASSQQNAIKQLLWQNQAKWWQIANSWW